jgi:hypothetical protein
MEKMIHPSQLFHGTPYEIHTSERPFLDPRLAGGQDEGDPEEGHVFATPDLLIASIFAFKDSGCRTIVKTEEGPVVVFDGKPPTADSEGFVYQVSPEGFEQTVRRGHPSGKWVMIETNMPLVKDTDGSETPGIPLNTPVRRVIIRDLIEQERLRVCILSGVVNVSIYSAAVRDAIHAGAETTFMREAVERGWLHDITNTFLETQPSFDNPE